MRYFPCGGASENLIHIILQITSNRSTPCEQLSNKKGLARADSPYDLSCEM